MVVGAVVPSAAFRRGAPGARDGMQTFLSGIQPSGQQHLGNYFGAIEQHIRAVEEPGEHFYFIADYHALTTTRDPDALRERTRETAITYLALGLDAVFFSRAIPSTHCLACSKAFLTKPIPPSSPTM